MSVLFCFCSLTSLLPYFFAECFFVFSWECILLVQSTCPRLKVKPSFSRLTIFWSCFLVDRSLFIHLCLGDQLKWMERMETQYPLHIFSLFPHSDFFCVCVCVWVFFVFLYLFSTTGLLLWRFLTWICYLNALSTDHRSVRRICVVHRFVRIDFVDLYGVDLSRHWGFPSEGKWWGSNECESGQQEERKKDKGRVGKMKEGTRQHVSIFLFSFLVLPFWYEPKYVFWFRGKRSCSGRRERKG